eukprot:CCRYP_001450-RB/>CCRYP_001450-RB protein AED:0.47 eAED:0.89 QI:0/0/0.33/1/0/0/3/37/115
MPVSTSKTNLTPSGGLFTKSLTSLATRANVLGGKFSEFPVMLATYPDEEADEGRREADREGRKDGLDDVGGGLEEGEFIIEEGSGKFVRIADGSDEGDDYDDGFSTGPRLSWNHI